MDEVHPLSMVWLLQGYAYRWLFTMLRNSHLAHPQAVLHELATHTLGLSLFATHYSSLTEDFAYHPNIRNMHMKTAVDDEKREVGYKYSKFDRC